MAKNVKILILAILLNGQMPINNGILGIYQKRTDKLAIWAKLELMWTMFNQVMAISFFLEILNAFWVHFLA